MPWGGRNRYVYSEIGDSAVQKSLKRYVYNEIGDSGGAIIIQMLRFSVGPLGWVWFERHTNLSNVTYIVKSAILEAQTSLKCYVYSEKHGAPS